MWILWLLLKFEGYRRNWLEEDSLKREKIGELDFL